ncbi:MAG: DUF3078 domain-containing protein, partial [Bacteroidales bacterium]|nr:DUF3078 domain-containing protein [Bacteroidales bacterium]
MKKTIFSVSLLLISLIGYAQTADTTYWKTEGDFSVQLNQASFTNWASGGDNSFAGVIGLNYSFNYAKAHNAWENKLILSYGMQSLDGD